MTSRVGSNYGPNAGSNNLARFRNAEFDALYRQSKQSPSAEARRRAYQRMAQIVGVWNPWGLRIYAIRSALVRPWVQGFQRNPHFFQVWRFCDVDVALQKAGSQRSAAR
jgi:ABC-type transport system substrate-binding protein